MYFRFIEKTLSGRNRFLKLSWIPLLLGLYMILYKIYIPHINAFGCFDDCNNFMGGYFLLQGKKIFSEFFFNHQPLAAYLSFLIQKATNPQNIFELVLRHRQFVVLLGFVFNLILIMRFGVRALLFAILFEFSKFYLFGDRFLSEGMIVYPLVYMTGLALLKFSKIKLLTIDYLLLPIFTWFVSFSREPYIPLAVFLYLAVILGEKFTKEKKVSAVIFLGLSFITLASFDFREYFFNVFTVNWQAVVVFDFAANGLPGPRIVQIILYPLYVPFFGIWNNFRLLLAGIDIAFLVYFVLLLKERKNIVAILILLILALSNIRVVVPGTTFYGAFHMLIWYGLFIFITSWLIFSSSSSKSFFITSIAGISLVFILFTMSPAYFAKGKTDQQFEFLTNYGPILQDGELVRNISNMQDTLFLDGSDDLIYWQAKRSSPYKYSWYTSAMVYFSKYTDARINMFRNAPPDFYRQHSPCSSKNTLPSFMKNDYVRLLNDNTPSCIYIRKEKLSKIPYYQWIKAKEWHYTRPKLD